MTTSSNSNQEHLDRIIADEFGVNADYVSGLLEQFEKNPNSLDEEWREYFDGLLRDSPSRESGPLVEPTSQEAPAPQEPTIDRDAPTVALSRVQPQSEAPLSEAARPETKKPDASQAERIPLRGAAQKIAENMEASLSLPTATSQRQIPLKLLDENRRLINEHLEQSGRKVSFTHLIARAILVALQKFISLNDTYEEEDGVPFRVRRQDINLGIAVDVQRKDGTRTLLVPNIKAANRLSFSQLLDAYDDIVRRARENKLQISDFQGTTVSLTNPGTIGTTASNPRLMPGQGLIVATGSIAYPPEYQAMAPEALSRIGISKAMTITSTYDHRIIQGAESGAFLALIDDLLRGKNSFYEDVFRDLGIYYRPYRWAIDLNPAILGEDRRRDEVSKQAQVLQLINLYRVRGHLIADLDPLGCKDVHYHPELDIETYGLTIWDLDREFINGGLAGKESATLREIVGQLRHFYCGKVGIEYRHIQGPDEKEWIRERVETIWPKVPDEARRQILWKLISAELFERFLGTKYLGQKRFSIEGNETVVALLDQLIESAGQRGTDDITIGMSHRGRLNVIANVIGKFCERIFTSFEGSIHPRFPHDQGDVKYHQGASGVRETAEGHQVSLAVAPNPSHLEFVDPVVVGMVRAKQDTSNGGSKLGVILHGDAAFAGEGVVAETLNLAELPGYSTSGTIHIVVNNQLGFTTPPEEGRSSTYCTDIAKMIQAPIFHVNGDTPDAAYHVLQIALDFRERFKKDVVIDVIGFRRHGHNEGDEPTYTQPVMYQRIREHPGVRELYARRLIRDGLLTQEEVDALVEERMRRYENALLGAKEIVLRQPKEFAPHSTPTESKIVKVIETGVDQEILVSIGRTITTVPRDFNLNPKIVGLLGRRSKMVEAEAAVDWGTAEALAFGSLLTEGHPIRISGQDTVRGTFSHRHASFTDTQSGQEWVPLKTLTNARFDIYDSPLSETGALGFEYGYSVMSQKTLVLWEAQFGDFMNAGQVIIDQFIASGEEKWNQTSRITLLLPHGYEGQGPEHSSARIERFLQLCAGRNIQVVNCTSASQYFHVLRRQIKQRHSKPLVIFTPKSLLRLPEASSPVEAFLTGGFLPVIGDSGIQDHSMVQRVLLCSGKVYYDLAAERRRLKETRTAIIRVEQLYPFPTNMIAEQINKLPVASDIRWVQEEPANQGAWWFIAPRLRAMLAQNRRLRYVGRAASATTATGSHTLHQMEQRQLVKDSFAD